MPTNIYAITYENGTIVFKEVDGSMSYNFKTQKFTYQFQKKTHILENVKSYKLIGHDEEAIRRYCLSLEEKKIQKMLNILDEIKNELENDYDQDDIAYELGKIIDQIEEKIMPKEYLDK